MKNVVTNPFYGKLYQIVQLSLTTYS